MLPRSASVGPTLSPSGYTVMPAPRPRRLNSEHVDQDRLRRACGIRSARTARSATRAADEILERMLEKVQRLRVEPVGADRDELAPRFASRIRLRDGGRRSRTERTRRSDRGTPLNIGNRSG